MTMSKMVRWAPLSVLFLLALSSTSLGVFVKKRPLLPRGGTLPNGGKIWALLVAGSNGYSNYRHQADVCHAYQILHKNGIPDENIVVMMYDDIAKFPDNPTPNVIINRPGGPNVYKGVPIDYSGSDVNSTVFINVLTGQTDAVRGIGSEKVINSGPKDHVFINFVDHGAPGFLCFPSDELHAMRLEKVLQQMVAKKRFSKMVWYVEACESGSMFDALLSDKTDIFVMTAADPRESSYACYYDQLRGTYLGDLFSVSWMEDSDKENLSIESLHHQFQLVRTETNTSHVEEYGDLDVGSLPVAYFQGYQSRFLSSSPAAREPLPPSSDAVNSRDVPLEILKRQYEAASDEKTKKSLKFKIRRMQKLRVHLDLVISDIAFITASGNETDATDLLESDNSLNSKPKFACYETLVSYFSSKCFKLSANPYALSKLKVFVNICSSSWASIKSAMKAMDAVCMPDRSFLGIF